jgi:hypothetical protein
MAYKQPKNTPIHNHGASEPISAIIGAAKLIKMGVVAAKAAKAAKAVKIAATAAKAAKAGKAAATAAKAAKAAKVAKAGLKAGKFAKAGKAASTAAKGTKAATTTAKATTKGAVKLTQQTMPKLQKLGEAGQKSVAKAQKLAKFSSKHEKLGKAIEKTKSLHGKAQRISDSGFDKLSEITGQDSGDLKAKAGEMAINKAVDIKENIKAKNESSGVEQEINPQLGVTDSTPEEEQPQSFPAQDRQSSYSNPSGASYASEDKSNKGFASEATSNKRAPKTNFVKMMHNLQNNQGSNLNIGGVSVNPGSVGLIGKFLIDSGIDAVKRRKAINAVKKERKSLSQINANKPISDSKLSAQVKANTDKMSRIAQNIKIDPTQKSPTTSGSLNLGKQVKLKK